MAEYLCLMMFLSVALQKIPRKVIPYDWIEHSPVLWRAQKLSFVLDLVWSWYGVGIGKNANCFGFQAWFY